MARRSLDYVKTLVVTSRVPLIKQWKDEFGKAGRGVDYMCIQSAYKSKKEYDLLIVDEIHRALSTKYRDVFKNIKYKYILGLTATEPETEESAAVLAQNCPVVYKKHLREVVEAGILPQFTIYNVAVPLDGKEKAKYKIFSNQFEQAAIELNRMRLKSSELSKKYGNPFDMASFFKDAKEDSPLRRSARKFWSGMSMRKAVVYSNPSKLDVVRQIINQFPNKK